MITSIHQLNYLPWLGFFNKVKQSDTFVMFDIADYVKQKFQNRNKIRTKDGWIWLIIPIERKYHRKPFFEVMLPKDNKWKQEHWLGIRGNYAKAPYFNSYKDFFESLYKKDFKTLMEINEKIMLYLFEQFGINVDIVKTTELDINRELKSTDLLIEILKKVNADNYLSGKSGNEYLEHDKFKQNKIELRFQEFKHPVYKQRFDGFEPYMSAIDLLFNVGEKSKELI